ncbi:hypothetical protein [Sphaerisporangium fuscum]|uniref:hypothetical protein n=1 Tax=Sphaerisporangium fuscum TaxID=2835868 RepID=UPI001BDD3826|nr:hypothetical protein [Sphaerisporangium fuscum]
MPEPALTEEHHAPQAEEAATPVKPSGAPDPGGPAAPVVRRGRARAAGALGVVAFTAVTAAGVLQWREASGLSRERATRLAVSSAAARFGRLLLTYDYRDLRRARQDVLALSTGDFLSTYDQAFVGGALQNVIVKLKAVSTASVGEVYVGDVDGARADALVPVDQQVTSDVGTRRVTGTYLRLKLLLDRGSWKVDQVVTLGAADEQVTGKDGTPVPGPDASPTPRRSGS